MPMDIDESWLNKFSSFSIFLQTRVQLWKGNLVLTCYIYAYVPESMESSTKNACQLDVTNSRIGAPHAFQMSEQPGSSEAPLCLSPQEDPLCWRKWKKWLCSSIVISMSLTLAYYSGVYAAAIPYIAAHYNCSRLAAVSGISFFLVGFASGPLLFAPLSEMYGRNVIIRTTLLLFVISNAGCALAPNIESHLVIRFFAGFFGAPTGNLFQLK